MTEESSRIAGKKRFFIFVVLFSLIGLVLIGRYAYLMLFSTQLPRVVRNERLAGRGPILDRNGRLLALETRLGNITLWRPEMNDVEELSIGLAPLIEQTPSELIHRINASQSDFIYLSRQVTEPVIRQIEAGIRDGRFRGVGIEPVVGRIYPERTLASQIIGFVGAEGTGLGGVEFAFDRELRGEQGTRFLNQGSQIFLTIDVNIQYILESIATRVMADTRAEAIIFMAMDPRTGDILGSASLPGFDPNMVRLSDEISRMDRPAIEAFEPGSTFKVFSLAALMDAGAIFPDTTFVCNGRYERVTGRGERITINCLGNHGRVNARDIIVYSCNAGVAYAADQMGSNLFYHYLREFGFGARTGAGNPGETAGFLRATERWSERSQPTISMGQEIAVSALQMLQAASAIANDGVLVPPRIISRIVSHDGRTQGDQIQARRVLSTETSRAMRNYMVDATSYVGTGWRAFVEDLSLGIKTGTAQMIDSQSGAYSSTDFIASAIALLPAESPSLVLYIAVIKPQGEIFGGRIAAPPLREAAEALVNYLGIPRGRNPQLAHTGAISIPLLPYPAVNETVPDFTGIAKRLLLPLLARDDLRFLIYGDGWVVRQNPAPGSLITPGTVIMLELE